MSRCVGQGCTHPGCSGRNADVVNAAAGGLARDLQNALYAAQRRSEARLQPENRAARRRREREARKGRSSG